MSAGQATRIFAGITGMLLAFTCHAQTYSKTEIVEYHDDLSLWVLGQVKRTTINGTETSKTEYGWKALPWKTYAFGKLQQQLGYDNTSTVASGQLGTLKQVIDGRANITMLTNWKRGVPGKITFPATTDQPTAVFQEAAINDDGTIASVTDENGYKTCYGYDRMGRLNKITYPSETVAGVCDASAWTPTTITFVGGNPGAYGMPAGHWRRTTLTGRGRKSVIYDALWRPVVEQTLDVDRVSATTSEIINRYDAAGRLAFQSYPMNTVGTANYADATLKGMHATYDALDRPLTVVQDSELGPLTTTTEYLSGFVTRVTNPRHVVSTTSYQAYDEPTTQWPAQVNEALDTTAQRSTAITRDPHGKPTAITRNGGGVSATRTYFYNTNQELCRSVEPETGATLMGYDGAGNLAWSAAGLPAAACSPTGTEPAIAARKATRTYDARNRLLTLTFANGLGNLVQTYHPDGQLKTIQANNGGGNLVTRTYGYNRRRLLTTEQIQFPNGGINSTIAHGYNAEGHVASLSLPGASPLTVNYAPNALGPVNNKG